MVWVWGSQVHLLTHGVGKRRGHAIRGVVGVSWSAQTTCARYGTWVTCGKRLRGVLEWVEGGSTS